jgi:hypothetical protein
LILIDLHGVRHRRLNSTSASLRKTPDLGKTKYLRDGSYSNRLPCSKWSEMNTEHIGLGHASIKLENRRIHVNEML